MILQALNRYYDILLSDPESGIAPPGYSRENVSFALNLAPDGELLSIFPLVKTVQSGKQTREVPLTVLVPVHVKRSSGIAPNFLCDNPAYVLGLSGKDAADPDYALKRFAAFREYNQRILAEVDCEEARALIAFLDNYDPRSGKEHPVIAPLLVSILEGSNLLFRLSTSGFVHEAAEIRRVWESHQASDGAEVISQCLVTGEKALIARLHPNLKGVKDANTIGAALVGFNAPAYESYNRTQGLNSPVSQKAAFAYTTALNYLLSRENKNPKFTIGDTTVVYWAESQNPGYAAVFSSLFGAGYADDDAGEAASARDNKAELRLREIAEKIRRAQGLDVSKLLDGLEGNPTFYVLGLAPNVARVSVRFFHTDPFQKMIGKIMSHYADLSIEKEYENQPDMIPIWQMLQETVSRKASDKKASPLMAGAVLRAILDNSPYPAALFYQLINRIRADMDDDKQKIKKINYIRAAVIKAYLTRKYRNQDNPSVKEVLCMALNEQSTNQAYLLGRLFAVLERAQQDAIGENIGATIKDRFFTSACATPATVFPILLRLSQHHISKGKYGRSNDDLIQKIMGLLDVDNTPFPAHLSLDQQGIFVLGYYHQRADFYKPRHNSTHTEEG